MEGQKDIVGTNGRSGRKRGKKVAVSRTKVNYKTSQMCEERNHKVDVVDVKAPDKRVQTVNTEVRAEVVVVEAQEEGV